jgi:hypothetical protein
MTDELFVIAAPFKRRGKSVLTRAEFLFALSLDLKWYRKEDAESILRCAVEKGVMICEGDKVKAKFDLNAVNLPQNFKPPGVSSLFKTGHGDVFEQIIDRIASGKNMKREEIIPLINKKHETVYRMIEMDVAALWAARELGVDVRDLTDGVWKKLFG